jgi:transposase
MNHVPKYGRSMTNQRAIIEKPGKRGYRHSLLLCIGHDRVIKWDIIKGSFNAISFRKFINDLPNDKVLVMDNARIHHATKSLTDSKLPTIRETADSKNIKLNYLPPYTPKLNPVELCFNIIRVEVNKKCPRTIESLTFVISETIKNIQTTKIIEKIWPMSRI